MKKVFTMVLFFVASNMYAQEKINSEVVDVFKVNFLTPGLSYEKKVGKSQTIVALAYLNTAISIGASSTQGLNSNILIDPALQVQYRFYYNYPKRKQMGKHTNLNSLNYIAPTLQTVFSERRTSTEYFFEANRRAMNTVGVVWGFQRNYKKRFSLDLNVGLGYLFTTATTISNNQPTKINIGEITLMSQLTLGIWLNKRK